MRRRAILLPLPKRRARRRNRRLGCRNVRVPRRERRGRSCRPGSAEIVDPVTGRGGCAAVGERKKDELVRIRSAVQAVGSLAADDRIRAAVAGDRIPVCAAEQHVGPTAAEQDIGALFPVDHVRAGIAAARVVAAAEMEAVIARAADEFVLVVVEGDLVFAEIDNDVALSGADHVAEAVDLVALGVSAAACRRRSILDLDPDSGRRTPIGERIADVRSARHRIGAGNRLRSDRRQRRR